MVFNAISIALNPFPAHKENKKKNFFGNWESFEMSTKMNCLRILSSLKT